MSLESNVTDSDGTRPWRYVKMLKFAEACHVLSCNVWIEWQKKNKKKELQSWTKVVETPPEKDLFR